MFVSKNILNFRVADYSVSLRSRLFLHHWKHRSCRLVRFNQPPAVPSPT